MRRLLLAAITAALAAASALTVGAAAGTPAVPVDGGQLLAQCYAGASTQVDDPGYRACRTVQAGESGTAAQCRLVERSTGTADSCGVIDGNTIDEQQISDYEHSWVHQALTLQRGLDAAAPLWEEQLPHTHNSFNSNAYALPTDGSPPSYYPTLTNQDPNQFYSLTDQLRMDIRAVELDLHWVPSPYGSAATNGYWVTLCHGDGEELPGTGTYAHAGCTDDRPAQDGFAELRRWLDANPHEFLLLYLENQLYPGGPVAGQEQAHDVAAQIIEDQLGDKVFTPPADLKPGSCASMPYDDSRADMLAQGKQVLIVGNCGPGAWNRWVFSRGSAWDESGHATDYGTSQCAADQQAREHHTSFRRFFEERTWLSAATAGAPGPLAGGSDLASPKTVALMVRCGVNIIGFDQLQPDDGRLAALVWSWAPGEPSAAGGACAEQSADGRFHAASCTEPHPFACVDRNLDWHVTHAAGQWTDGPRVCSREFPGSAFGVPPNGYRNAQLASARTRNPGPVWLDYRRVAGTWTANA